MRGKIDRLRLSSSKPLQRVTHLAFAPAATCLRSQGVDVQVAARVLAQSLRAGPNYDREDFLATELIEMSTRQKSALYVPAIDRLFEVSSCLRENLGDIWPEIRADLLAFGK
jgi:hypothetical protein